ncbi:MAG: ABC transporter permease [Bacteroidales bacterium]|nr:ABC transporter permease [Bacteroidales bacterium]MCF6341963.1 ABC transporter permease [Bacteroidales bacterium]
MIILKLLYESLLFAINALVVNKVRTVLSLLGITIGIFSIISVFTVFDSMENSIKSEINSLGSNVLFIQKWPWAMGKDYPWWKYYQRPEPRVQEMEEIKKRSATVEEAAFMFSVSRNVYFRNNSMAGIPIVAVSQAYNRVMPFDLQQGRYFTSIESHNGNNIAIIGSEVAEKLYQGIDPVGRTIKVFGRKLDIIGVIKKQGEDILGNSKDNWVMIPVNYARNVLDVRNIGSTIIVVAKPNISNDQMMDELTGVMRSIRKLPPRADDSFALNETDIISKGFDELFAVIASVGWIIGGFSLLVGGFGIANIMFVSVRERTNQIGIQKSLGAKNYFILVQFLFEAVFLAVMGGIVGLLIVYLLTFAVSSMFSFDLILTYGNVMLGLLVSAFIGLVSGFVPAWSAARLDPVEAMRHNF